MERKRRISAPFLRTGLNNYRQSKTAAQPENTIIALIQAGIADNIFSPIMFGFTDACRHDGCLVVAAQGFIIRSQDNLPFSGMGYNARLQVIADKTRGNPAEEPIHVDVGADKAVHLHVPAWFHVGVLAVGQCSSSSLASGCRRNSLQCL